MKRVLVVAALAVFAAGSGLAGATVDLSLQDPPGAPALTVPLPLPEAAVAPAPTESPAPAPASALPAPAPALPAPAGETAPAADESHDAQLHADLCAARPVFCEVDESGHYRQ